ncbi:MAG TPA: transcription antitermination factor NusB [Clostridiaceae bacterium]|jgi:N utilization substance protein B|nr:transcription antitermination factor NusB [Clostridiaceae bacterium]
MGRKASRELAMKLLYQLEIQKDDREKQIEMALNNQSVREKDKEYILDVIYGVFKNLDKIDEKIEKCSKGWKISRISRVDLSILRLGIFELLYRDDIPSNVSINEAIEMAKKYSGQDAGSFVNGVLGKVAEDLENKKEPRQSGENDSVREI